MVMINEEGDRAGTSNGGNYRDQQQQDSYDKDFPPGYRFQPTDQELIRVYLFRKVNVFQLPPNRFVDVNIYSCNPWELAARYESYGESIHYFFTPREKKYPNGYRPNRAAGVGYWKACGADKPIYDEVTNQKILGFKRSLVFYRGKPSPKAKGEKTNWIMHEYTLKKPEQEEKVEKKICTTSRKNQKPCPNLGNPKTKQLDEFVLCKLYLKLNKSTKDTGYPNDDPCDEDITQENNIDVATPSSGTSMATATTSAAMPENYHQMHQYPSTSMTVVGTAAALEEMTPFSNRKYSDDINPSSAVSSSAILPSINHPYHDEDVWEMLRDWNNDIDHPQSNYLGSAGWINDIDSQSNFSSFS